jgi:hypothetical protein
MKSTEFRMFPIRLFLQQSFIVLTPTAKTAYFAIQSQLPSFAFGEIVLGTLPRLVGCTDDEFDRVLTELYPEWLELEGGIAWLHGSAESMPWGSEKYLTYVRRNVAHLPEGELIDRFRDDFERRAIAQAAQRDAGKSRRATDKTARPQSRESDTVSIQKEKEVEAERSLLLKGNDKGARTNGSTASAAVPQHPRGASYQAVVSARYGPSARRLKESELEALLEIEEKYGGADEVVSRFIRLVDRVGRESLTVDELKARWEELADDDAAPF